MTGAQVLFAAPAVCSARCHPSDVHSHWYALTISVQVPAELQMLEVGQSLIFAQRFSPLVVVICS
jgi:hypothetical protein